ncbi:MAG: nucleoside deaminase [Chitinophagaceae bacterium]
MSDEFFMQQALKEAYLAFEEDEVPIGAVVVMHNKIISRGHNQVEKLTDPTAHAEMIALTAAFNYLGSKYLPEASIFITVEPCLMCAGALYWSKIGNIIYGADDPKNGYNKRLISSSANNIFLNKPFHPKTKLVTGVLKDNCYQVLKDFFEAKR